MCVDTVHSFVFPGDGAGCSDSDGENFSRLVGEARERFGTKYLLTAALPAKGSHHDGPQKVYKA